MNPGNIGILDINLRKISGIGFRVYLCIKPIAD
jgi:hypothetical protein